MAIGTLAELETAISDRLARSDFTSAQRRECIAFAEARAQRQLRAVDMETVTTSFSIATEYVSVPSDFLQARDFYITTTTLSNLELVAPEHITRRYSGYSGRPRVFAVLGGQFRFGPAPDGTYTATLNYFAKIPALSDTQITNWLLTSYPDAYLYGALMEASIRVQDAEGAQGYGQLFGAALDEITRSGVKARFSGPPLTMRPE